MTRKTIRTAALAALAALGMAVGQSECAYAAFTFTIDEQGADVIITGSGSINLSGLSSVGTDVLPDSGFMAQLAVAGVAGTVSVYSGITGPGSFGPGGFVIASSGSGDAAAVNGSMGVLGVPTDYVSGSDLSNSMVFTGQTFASLGLTPGTYTWVWDSGAVADSLTVQIGAAAVPEPASALLLGAGLLGLAAVCRHFDLKIGSGANRS